jgi:hypothetical protein
MTTLRTTVAPSTLYVTAGSPAGATAPAADPDSAPAMPIVSAARVIRIPRCGRENM